ncbi:MAG: dihydropteroate synthase [Halioglobus sp.]
MVSRPLLQPASINCGGRNLDLTTPCVMGVVNTTPDSFSDGGTLYHNNQLDLDLALTRASLMAEAGAAIVDIGGESTRPGAQAISVQQELDRVVPVIERIVAELDVIVSVDTSSAVVMETAAAAGAGLINDVRSLTRDGALEAATVSGLPVCLMHMQGNPDTMQASPHYEDVVSEVLTYLDQRMRACEHAGIAPERILLDPGFGFGKTVQHNLQLLKALPKLVERGLPVLVGLSRKSMISHIIGRDVDDRLSASLALAVLAAERGANIIRTHDVAETADALAMVAAVKAIKSTGDKN